MNNTIELLPLEFELESKEILKTAALAHQSLGELKGVVQKVPNEQVLLNLLPLQEAQCSSEIENIITTKDELYKSKIENYNNTHTKEVRNYEKSLIQGFNIVKKEKLLTNNTIYKIQKTLMGNDAGLRAQIGTVLKNQFGETVYTPPQDINEIKNLMKNLEQFINDNELSDLNPLVKMAVIHHQFESIHPFYDGNGRTGRIINILYLHLQGLLDLPILYLSRYIIDNKGHYYRLLQEVREKNNWQEWILFIIKGIHKTSQESILLIQSISSLMTEFKQTIRKKYPKIYSQDLINSLFKYPYTKIMFISEDLKIYRQTAAKYLNILTKEQLMTKTVVGKNHYYVNQKLINIAIDLRKKNDNT